MKWIGWWWSLNHHSKCTDPVCNMCPCFGSWRSIRRTGTRPCTACECSQFRCCYVITTRLLRPAAVQYNVQCGALGWFLGHHKGGSCTHNTSLPNKGVWSKSIKKTEEGLWNQLSVILVVGMQWVRMRWCGVGVAVCTKERERLRDCSWSLFIWCVYLLPGSGTVMLTTILTTESWALSMRQMARQTGKQFGVVHLIQMIILNL